MTDEIDRNTLLAHMDNQPLVEQVIQQIVKDFNSFQLDFHFSGEMKPVYPELRSQIGAIIHELASTNPGLCSALLYRIDIPEEVVGGLLE